MSTFAPSMRSDAWRASTDLSDYPTSCSPRLPSHTNSPCSTTTVTSTASLRSLGNEASGSYLPAPFREAATRPQVA